MFANHITNRDLDFQTPATYGHDPQGTIVCRYNWHSAGTLVWPFLVLTYKYIFQIKYMETILCSRKLLWFEITKIPKC